jgi:hypothetical protein
MLLRPSSVSVDSFLKSSNRGFIFQYQVSNDNPQKIIFTISFLALTKDSFCVVLNVRPSKSLLFLKGVVNGERPLKVPL